MATSASSQASGVSAEPARSLKRRPAGGALSRREIEVLRLIVEGRSNGEIAHALYISKKTASVHVANIKGKLGALSRIEIVTNALALGLVEAPDHPMPGLEALVLRVLEKNPPKHAAMPGEARDLVGALDTRTAPAPVAAVDTSLGASATEVLVYGHTFVGREAELKLLERAFDAASAGRSGLVMVVGEPGIGKTRIAAELATHARLRRAQVLWGRCYESAGAPPYWPFVQSLRGYVREHGQEQLRRQLGSVAAALAEIVPEINDKLPDLAPLPAAEPAQARFRLFDSVTAFLRAASTVQPILFVLDDLHCADAGTLALLEFLARELEGSRLLVVGTFREVELTKGHPLTATLAELTRELTYERVTLKGLTGENVGRFIAGTAGITPPDALVSAVYRHTEGNPLFVTEVVRLLTQEGALAPAYLAAQQRWSVRIPDGVREVISRRIERLSEPCQGALRTAAVVGREFSLEQLAAIVDDPEDDRLLGTLEEALAARVIEEIPGLVGRFIFTHALVQDTLVAGLSATRLARLHGHIGEVLERFYGDRAAEHAAELAYHFGEARAMVGSERFTQFALLAGDQALAAHAFEEAIEHFSQAIAATEDAPVDASTAAAHQGLGQAQAALTPMSVGDSEAVGHIALAFDWYLAAGDHDRAVAAATELPMAGLGMPPAAREMVSRALRHVPLDSRGAGRLLALDGWYLGTDDADYEAAAAAFARALEIARQHDDRSLEVRVLAHWSYVDWGHLRRQECLEHSRAAVELVVDGRDDYGAFVAHVQALRASMLFAEQREALAYGAAALAIAERLRMAVGLARTCAEYANVYMAVGDWERARPLLDRGVAADPHSGYEDLSVSLEAQVGNTAAVAGHLDHMEVSARTAPQMQQLMGAVVGFGVLADWISGAEDHLDLAASRAAAMLAQPKALPMFVFAPRIAQALVAIKRRNLAAAEAAYEGLAAQSGWMLPYWPMACDHVLGLLAQTMGHEQRALDHFDAALALSARAGYRPAYGWAAADYSELLLDRGDPADHGRAIALGNEALAIARELGMRPLVERVLARREFLNA